MNVCLRLSNILEMFIEVRLREPHTSQKMVTSIHSRTITILHRQLMKLIIQFIVGWKTLCTLPYTTSVHPQVLAAIQSDCRMFAISLM